MPNICTTPTKWTLWNIGEPPALKVGETPFSALERQTTENVWRPIVVFYTVIERFKTLDNSQKTISRKTELPRPSLWLVSRPHVWGMTFYWNTLPERWMFQNVWRLKKHLPSHMQGYFLECPTFGTCERCNSQVVSFHLVDTSLLSIYLRTKPFSHLSRFNLKILPKKKVTKCILSKMLM